MTSDALKDNPTSNSLDAVSTPNKSKKSRTSSTPAATQTTKKPSIQRTEITTAIFHDEPLFDDDSADQY